jgi:hypothetical protein
MTAVVIIVFTSIIFYKIIDYMDTDDSMKDYIKMLIGLFLGFSFSVLISYSTIESDTLLTENFWD